MLRAAVRAVATGGAGDQVLALEDLLHPLDGGQLGLVQRLEIRHEGGDVLHLLQTAHAREYHQHAVKARREAERIAGGAAAVQRVKDRSGLEGIRARCQNS